MVASGCAVHGGASADPAIRRYNGAHDRHGYPAPPLSLPGAEAAIDQFMAGWRTFAATGTAAGVVFAIADAGSGELVGCCGVDDWNTDDVAQFGYWLTADARGHGYATRAVVLLTRWLFELGAARVFLTIVADNDDSVAVARRAGFVYEGTMRAHSVWQGERCDVMWFAALSHEWTGEANGHRQVSASLNAGDPRTAAAHRSADHVATMSESHLLLIGGRSGVGKSTVAAEVHRQLSERGVQHAWIEGDNLDMAFPVPWKQGYQLAEANLTPMWSNYRAHGYRRLIYVNTASVLPHVIDALTTAMGDNPTVTSVLLTSSDEVARQRLTQREVGGGLDYAVRQSTEAALGLQASAAADVARHNTDERTPAQLAVEIIKRTEWRPG